eukprot:gnl/Hemi2/6553_TR2237_c0_g1_i1.p1 gnl/Hemi2/6553_TR2237_c0_g1~~gnl/Hemi2/6553_TR2237_c0_g1_i1.p1  ORF type:complete len:574 (+),score=129.61 gnl/Hemi2/6553_TR2237_c0_g1_i1:44-1723(+)
MRARATSSLLLLLLLVAVGLASAKISGGQIFSEASSDGSDGSDGSDAGGDEFPYEPLMNFLETRAKAKARSSGKSGYLQDFDSPLLPDLRAPKLEEFSQYFANSPAPPVAGDCNCGQCRQMIKLKFDMTNCLMVFNVTSGSVTSDEAGMKCGYMQREITLMTPEILHAVSWYVCSCVGCCPGDCFYRPALVHANSEMRTTLTSPISPITECDSKDSVMQYFNYVKCRGLIKYKNGWKRVLSIDVPPEICMADILSREEAYQCLWLQNVLENQLEGVTDRPLITRTVYHGLNDYAMHYACTCLGCGAGDIKCLYNGPVFEYFKSPYHVWPATNLPAPQQFDASVPLPFPAGQPPPPQIPKPEKPITDQRASMGLAPLVKQPEPIPEPEAVKQFREAHQLPASPVAPPVIAVTAPAPLQVGITMEQIHALLAAQAEATAQATVLALQGQSALPASTVSEIVSSPPPYQPPPKLLATVEVAPVLSTLNPTVVEFEASSSKAKQRQRVSELGVSTGATSALNTGATTGVSTVTADGIDSASPFKTGGLQKQGSLGEKREESVP